MNLTLEATELLKNVLSICRSMSIDSIAITGGKVMGLNEKRNLCIISDIDLGIDKQLKIGIGRVSELEKRLMLFPNGCVLVGKVNDKNDVSLLTMSSGKSKAQFRCTSIAMMKYPKANEDEARVVVTFSKDDVVALVKALRTFSAETAIMKIGMQSDVLVEFTDKTNDQFSMTIDSPAEFIDDSAVSLFTYSADNLAIALDVGAKESDSVVAMLGGAGSLTIVLKGHTVILLPNVDED